MSNNVSESDAANLRAYFARVNWNAHLVPLIPPAIERFKNEITRKGCPQPQIHLSADDHGESQGGRSIFAFWRNSISIHCANHAHTGEPGSNEFGSGNSPVDGCVSLTFDQTASGMIFAVIHLPFLERSTGFKACYLADAWRDPMLVGEKEILALLRLVHRAELSCRIETWGNGRAARIMADLRTRDAIYSVGGTRFWAKALFVLEAAKIAIGLCGAYAPMPRVLSATCTGRN